MPFNLYYAGGKSKVADEQLAKTGGLRLLSYWNDRKFFEEREQHGLQTFLDSGAFTAWTKGIEVDVDEYIRYVNEHDAGLSYFCQVDKIPGSYGKDKTTEELLHAQERTWENYLYMRERVKSPDKLLPVFHFGSNFDYLYKILEHEPRIDYFCLGALVGKSKKERILFFDEVFKRIAASGNPQIKVHALGMTDLDLLELYPIYSADSTGWIMVGGNGYVYTKFGNILVSEVQKNDPSNFSNQPEIVQQQLLQYFEEHGSTLQDLQNSYHSRFLLCIAYLNDWAANYTHKPKTVQQTKLF